MYYFNNNQYDIENLFKNEAIPFWLILLGIVSQTIFTLRFVYQWFYSEKRKESMLPFGFWMLSLIGSLLILVYAVIRKDPVLFAGHIMGGIVYTRNLMILKKMKLKLYIAALCFLGLLLINNHLWGLTETSEARYAEISKEMFENNTLAHPTLLGIYHYHKPPFTYQITTIGYQLFGVNEFGARFFLQISFLIQIILVYLIAFRLFPIKKTALIAALLYASSPIAIMASKNLTTDSYLTTWVLLSIYSWLQAKSKHPYYTFLFYGAIAMGFLTKGPLVLLPVLLFIGSWKLIKKKSQHSMVII